MRTLSLIGLITLSFISFNCKKEKTASDADAGLPVLSTVAVTHVTATSFETGGNITSEGKASITLRGVCWATSSNPDISGSHTEDGSGSGSYTANLVSLNSGVTYFIRAYASNSYGTAYGNELTVTLPQRDVYVVGQSSDGSYATATLWKNGNTRIPDK